MKRLLKALAMCQSMFCALPVLGNFWDEEARSLMLLFLPLVGLEIGLLWQGLAWLCGVLGLPALLSGLFLCLFPYLITGGIHLDGYMDVADAMGSCRDLEKRRAILKDPHIGSFAALALGMALLSGFALLSQGGRGSLWLIPVVSRCGSALAVTGLRPMSGSQYAGARPPAWQKGILWAALAAAGIAAWFFGSIPAYLGGIAGYFLAAAWAYRGLDGMNGDVAGYALTVSELTALAFAVCWEAVGWC